ncbi:MAG: polyprenol monophosphomannose synthase [Thaumarchaeota archaeon]|nr:polyprenol monophosphomannose synthase [Nitrososphaerota archaeon]
MDGNVVIVDDSSPDGTTDAVRVLKDFEKKVFLVVRPCKMGLGSAYAEGYKYSLQNLSPNCIIQMDADLSHPPKLVTKLAKAVEEGFDVSIGSRYVEGGGTKSWSFIRRLVSKGANVMVRILLGTRLQDNTSGYRAMKPDVVKAILEYEMRSKGYGYNAETIYLFAKLKLRVKEIPFIYETRQKGKTKLSFIEIVKFFFATLRLWLFGLKRIALPVGPET